MTMLTQQKVAQMAAFLLHQCGERMSHLKLMKLLYLADREGMRQLGAPISGDNMVSMPHGPVLSTTLDLMEGNFEPTPGGWEEWISDQEDHQVSLRQKPVSREVLDELSDAELEILESIWCCFGSMDQWELRDYTHQHCPEWEDPEGSSRPIDYLKVLRHVGWDEEHAKTLANQLEAEHQLDRSLSG